MYVISGKVSLTLTSFSRARHGARGGFIFVFFFVTFFRMYVVSVCVCVWV